MEKYSLWLWKKPGKLRIFLSYFVVTCPLKNVKTLNCEDIRDITYMIEVVSK